MINSSILQRYGRLLCLFFAFVLPVMMHAGTQDDVKITLNLEKVTLETAIDVIKEQSLYLFLNKGVDLGQTVSINVENASIRNTCDALFSPIGVGYRIEGNYIYLTKAEQVKVSGTVRDGSGQPVPGAAVIETGTSNGTMTDLDGKFLLTVGGGRDN